MASVLQTASPDALRRIQRVQTVTIVWMSVEAVVSLFAAWRARSPALLAFGGDSAIELFSAVVVLWRFRASAAHEDAERRAARVAGALLFALAAYVAITSVVSLLGYSEPKPTFLGIAILVAAATVMPWLAKEKRNLACKVGRPDCGFRRSAAHRLGGSGSHAREAMRLLLDSTTLGIDRSVSCQTQRTISKKASPATDRSRSA